MPNILHLFLDGIRLLQTSQKGAGTRCTSPVVTGGLVRGKSDAGHWSPTLAKASEELRRPTRIS